MQFIDALVAQIKKKNTPLCVGIDPNLERIPAEVIEPITKEHGYTVGAAGLALEDFSKGIIEAVAEYVPAIKPQLAYFEQYGAAGMLAFQNVCDYAKEAGLLVIADGKRNDIGTTAEAYAKAYLGEVSLFGNEKAVYGIDALTVTPYLGFDGVNPFMKECAEHGKGIFVLVRTSNPSAGDLQDRYDEAGLRNFEYMAHFVDSWGADLIGESGFSAVGAVVGATYPQDMKKLRELMPNTYFLMPGFGAQGGTAADLKTAFTDDGLGVLVPSSRSINYAYEKNESLDYQTAAKERVKEMIKQLRAVLA